MKSSLVAQLIKNPPANAGDAGDTVLLLRQEDALEKETATHSSIIAWEILWMEKSGGLQFMGSQITRHNWAHTHISPASFRDRKSPS